MNKRQLVLTSNGQKYTVKVRWERSRQYFVDRLLLVLNDKEKKKSLIHFLNVKQREHKLPIPLHPTLSDNISDTSITLYGLAIIRFETGHWFYGIKTSGAMDSIDVDGILQLELDTIHTSPRPLFKEKDTFPLDIIHHPESSYSLSTHTRPNVNEQLIIFLEENPWQKQNEFKKYVFVHYGSQSFHIPFPLEAAVEYKVYAKKGNITKTGGCLVDSHAHVSKLTYMTSVELKELFWKAVRHVKEKGGYYVVLSHFYRTKPERYFQQIKTTHKGVMKKYIKNFGGDQSSTLNRNIHGLFFSASLDPTTLQPPLKSPYGDLRLHIPVSNMLNWFSNLYFADFYCHYKNHRITLVLTSKNTEADIFCQQRLLRLNPGYNPFLTKNILQNYALVTMGAIVEIFYTDDIDIKFLIKNFPEKVFFTKVEGMGNPELKTIIGIEKKKGCIICNLDKTFKESNISE